MNAASTTPSAYDVTPKIRPSFRIGFSIDDFEETSFESENEVATQEFQLDAVDEQDDDEEEDEEEAPDGE